MPLFLALFIALAIFSPGASAQAVVDLRSHPEIVSPNDRILLQSAGYQFPKDGTIRDAEEKALDEAALHDTLKKLRSVSLEETLAGLEQVQQFYAKNGQLDATQTLRLQALLLGAGTQIPPKIRDGFNKMLVYNGAQPVTVSGDDSARSSDKFSAQTRTAFKRATLPWLWSSAEVPENWAVCPHQDCFELPGISGQETPTVSVSFEAGEEDEATARLRELIRPSKENSRRGAWSWAETEERGPDGQSRRRLTAVLSAPGGWYLVRAQSRAAAFAALRPDVLRLLDGFRREAPTMPLADYSDPNGRFDVRAPTAPWIASLVSGGGVDFFGAPGPGNEPRAVLSIRRVTCGKRYPDADAYVRAETASKKDSRSGSVRSGRTTAGEWRRFETETVNTSKSARRKTLMSTAEAVLVREKEFFVLTLQASPAGFDDEREAFEAVVASFRPLPK